MKVKRLRDPRSYENAPQCSEPTPESDLRIWKAKRPGYWKYRLAKAEGRGFDPERCNHYASFRINGKPYCAHHAGQIALRELMK